eukprot:TRINITY_DN24556_c0_g1_i3.p2 TRINITY_DN24556_c0_g1~~TRINITY_DN24556_c0_g1_i3.p2  ORF type:complete len:112 (+),score=8.85 TRINITY_DN24556_c0_g1_i3:95-430(+)
MSPKMSSYKATGSGHSPIPRSSPQSKASSTPPLSLPQTSPTFGTTKRESPTQNQIPFSGLPVFTLPSVGSEKASSHWSGTTRCLVDGCEIEKIGRAVQQECRDRSRMPSSA